MGRLKDSIIINGLQRKEVVRGDGMKARMTVKGELIINSEDELESFALNMWFKDYDSKGEGKSILRIEPIALKQEEGGDKHGR